MHPFRDGNTRTIVTYAFRFAEEHGFRMDRKLLLDNFAYVRKSLVKASDGEYSDYQYLYRIIKDSIQRGEKIELNESSSENKKMSEDIER